MKTNERSRNAREAPATSGARPPVRSWSCPSSTERRLVGVAAEDGPAIVRARGGARGSSGSRGSCRAAAGCEVRARLAPLGRFASVAWRSPGSRARRCPRPGDGDDESRPCSAEDQPELGSVADEPSAPPGRQPAARHAARARAGSRTGRLVPFLPACSAAHVVEAAPSHPGGRGTARMVGEGGGSTTSGSDPERVACCSASSPCTAIAPTPERRLMGGSDGAGRGQASAPLPIG